MHLPEVDKYAHLQSPLHGWDPRLKLICLTGLIFSIVLISSFRLALLGLVFSLIMVHISRIPLSFILKHLRWVLFFVSFFFLIMPLTVPGTEVARFHSVRISFEGISCASMVAIKAITAVLLIFPMIGTMKFSATIKTLERLNLPNRLVQLTMFTYRYIFLFIDEAQKMSVAIDSRGFKKGANLHTLKTIGKLVGMLFVRSYERAERVYQAMISRGYTGNFKSLEEEQLRIRVKDVLKAILVGSLAMGFMLVEMIQ